MNMLNSNASLVIKKNQQIVPTGSWSALGRGGLYDGVISWNVGVGTICALDPSNIFVGGDFASVIDASGNNVTNTKMLAKWNNNTNTWSSIWRSQNQQYVNVVAALDSSNIFVGGYTNNNIVDLSGNSIANTRFLAKWNNNTSRWSPLAGSGTSQYMGIVATIAILDASNIFIGGEMGSCAGNIVVPNTYGLFKYNNNTDSYSSICNATSNFQVYDLSILDSSNIFVGGYFTNVKNTSNETIAYTAYIAKYNNNTNVWTPLGRGLSGAPNAIYALDASNIFVGGAVSFYDSAGAVVSNTNGIAKWNSYSNTWSTLGRGVAGGAVTAITAIDPTNIIISGAFSTVNDFAGATVPNTAGFAKWNTATSTWSSVFSGYRPSPSSYASCITQMDPSNVFVGGFFNNVVDATGSIVTNTKYIAKWTY